MKLKMFKNNCSPNSNNSSKTHQNIDDDNKSILKSVFVKWNSDMR